MRGGVLCGGAAVPGDGDGLCSRAGARKQCQCGIQRLACSLPACDCAQVGADPLQHEQ